MGEREREGKEGGRAGGKKKGEEAIRHVHAKGCYTDIHVQFEITLAAHIAGQGAQREI